MIPVKERLPELTEPLIGYDEGDNTPHVLIENYKATVMGYNKEQGFFKAVLTKQGWAEVASISVNSTIKPTHWQPWPDAPETT
jgi:hypothetical protein